MLEVSWDPIYSVLLLAPLSLFIPILLKKKIYFVINTLIYKIHLEVKCSGQLFVIQKQDKQKGAKIIEREDKS